MGRFRIQSLLSKLDGLRRQGLIAACVVALISTSACIDFERVITIGREGAGRARFGFSMNFEPMIRMALAAERKAQGSDVPPTAGEIAEAMEEIGREFANEKPIDKVAIAKGLPKGITLVDATQKLDGTKMLVDMVFGFDDVRKLPTLAVSDPTAGLSDLAAGGANLRMLRPFEGVSIDDDGRTITFSGRPLVAGGSSAAAKPTADAASANALNDVGKQLAELMQDMGGPPELKSVMDGIIKTMKETFRIEASQGVIETNAMRKDGTALIWEFNIETVTRMSAEDRNKLLITAKVRR